MNNVQISLSDLVGKAYIDAVCAARAFVENSDKRALLKIAEAKVDLVPAQYLWLMDGLVNYIGQQICDGLPTFALGAGTDAFRQAIRAEAAPLTGFGFIRIGEDGRVYLCSKSEHYHASLGHSFPGYKLIEHAQRLGIPNATHNNTRGHITRMLEQELVRVANGIAKGDDEHLDQVMDESRPHLLNRVINLETGSLAVEAALKMMLARFYRLDEMCDEPKYAGRIPVVLVMADHAGGKKANYHGTTILTQIMRGMWPELGAALEKNGQFVVRPVRINDGTDFENALAEYETEPYKVAGFFHEIVLMNYGGIKLDETFLRRAYALCDEHDVPTMVDEIQSCIWSPEFFLFREYGLQPDFVSIGKGFPGGQYPASRILTTAAMDNLNLFGALVTNGQEELAALAYLVTMAFVEANKEYISTIGDDYHAALQSLAQKYPTLIDCIEGHRHLSSIFFHSVDKTVQFIAYLVDAGIDISAHTYKAECPPAALTKIPLIATPKMVAFLIDKMDEALARL
ncbi:MAG: aminotransferase class III-fold pyridoxal phosphate-dependent enzyme [Anaerolineae bacterium]|nr:aminotransferase class III-fold pyridoxal phosphate-dependent enzyme [Anaerolineae bacterium]